MVTIRNHNVVLSGDFTHKLNPKVLYELGKISVEDQLQFQNNYLGRERSLKLAYVCLLFFPTTHYAFMGKWQLQVLFWLTLGGGLIWWLADFFRLRELVRQKNQEIQKQVLRDIHAVNVFKPVLQKPQVQRKSVKLA